MKKEIAHCRHFLSTGQLLQGVPMMRILDNIRDSAAPDRTALLERRDLLNVIRDFGINKEEERHADDATSVHMLAQELKEKGEVLFYKARGN